MSTTTETIPCQHEDPETGELCEADVAISASYVPPHNEGHDADGNRSWPVPGSWEDLQVGACAKGCVWTAEEQATMERYAEQHFNDLRADDDGPDYDED